VTVRTISARSPGSADQRRKTSCRRDWQQRPSPASDKRDFLLHQPANILPKARRAS